MPNDLRCAVYAAVSSGPQAAQDKVSIEVQLNQGRAIAERHGAAIVAELVVPGQSRSIDLWEDAIDEDTGIPAFRELALLLAQKAIDVLIFLNWSRLARTESLGAGIRAKCRRAGVQLYDISNPPQRFGVPEYNQGRRIVDAVLTIGAQAEVEELVRRNAEGMRGRVLAGKMPNGQPAWGYVKKYREDGTEYIEVDPDAAVWVQRLFAWYVAGESGGVIADKLNAAGLLRPRGGAWDFWSVYKVLDLAWRYAGYSEINRRSDSREYVKAKGKWPAIISEELAQRALSEREARKHDRGLANTGYVLSGIVWCEVCHCRMRIQRHKSRDTVWIVCPNKHRGRTVKYDSVIAYLEDAIAELENLDLGELEQDPDSKAPAIAYEIQQHARDAQKLLAARQRTNDLYVHGHVDLDTYTGMVDKIDRELAELRGVIDSLTTWQTNEEAKGTRAQRVAELADEGLLWLREGTPEANAKLRQFLRVYVRNCRPYRVEWRF